MFVRLTCLNSGRSIKYCSFAPTPTQNTHQTKTTSTTDAAQEVFMNTLSFFCALKERGCRLDSAKYGKDDDGGSSGSVEEEEDKELIWTLTHSRMNYGSSRCTGKFILEYVNNRPLIR